MPTYSIKTLGVTFLETSSNPIRFSISCFLFLFFSLFEFESDIDCYSADCNPMSPRYSSIVSLCVWGKKERRKKKKGGVGAVGWFEESRVWFDPVVEPLPNRFLTAPPTRHSLYFLCVCSKERERERKRKKSFRGFPPPPFSFNVTCHDSQDPIRLSHHYMLWSPFLSSPKHESCFSFWRNIFSNKWICFGWPQWFWFRPNDLMMLENLFSTAPHSNLPSNCTHTWTRQREIRDGRKEKKPHHFLLLPSSKILSVCLSPLHHKARASPPPSLSAVLLFRLDIDRPFSHLKTCEPTIDRFRIKKEEEGI